MSVRNTVLARCCLCLFLHQFSSGATASRRGPSGALRAPPDSRSSGGDLQRGGDDRPDARCAEQEHHVERGGDPVCEVKAYVLPSAEYSYGELGSQPKPLSALEADKHPQTAATTLDAAKEQATFTFANELPAGKVTLEIPYTGILNDKLRGFYLSKTKTRNYAVTQFEATDARRAFPCFDEPALKATFDIALMVDTGDTAISNTKVISRQAGAGGGQAHGEVCDDAEDVDLPGGVSGGGFQVHGGQVGWGADPGLLDAGQGGADAVCAGVRRSMCLHYYDNYFGIKYPMPKLDMVAIPDFEAGAMENFGCITYRETDLLVDAKTARHSVEEARGGGGGARDGAPVVRRHGDDAVVGQPVAE